MKLCRNTTSAVGKLMPPRLEHQFFSSPFPARFRPSPAFAMNSGILARLFILAGILLLLPIAQVSAATITVGAGCTFKQAWDSAFDDDAPEGSDCVAGSGNDIIVLNADVVLGAKIWEGSAGSGTLTINGNGHAIRGDGTYAFFGLWGAPTITFNNITFTGAAGDDRESGGAFNPYSGAGTYTFNDCVFHNNTAVKIVEGTGGNGGAISAGTATTVNINRCAFYNNRAEVGGAIFTGGVLTISNSSFYNNRSVREGGAINASHTDTSRRVTLRHVTMTNNRGGTDSGALQLAQSNVGHVRNSILYGNTPRDCYVHSSQVAGFVGKLPNEQGNPSSFIGVSNCDFEQRNYGDQRNPQLAGPFNGFYIPRAGSPAINFATCLASTIAGYNEDQRGQPRPLAGETNSQCDAGAIEHRGYVPPPSPRSDDDGGGGGGGGDDDEASDQQAAKPAVSTCLTLDGIAAYNISESTQCQRVNAMQIANPNIKEGDFVDAVDVWSWVMPNTQICFEASGGAFTFIDTAAMPRTMSDLAACSLNGMACAAIDGPGILVLLPGDATEACAGFAPAAPPIPAAPKPVTRSLSSCMVKTTAVLRFRESPGGGLIIREWIPDSLLPKDVTLTAVERTDSWFKVDWYGVKGWISADYVETEGTCA